MVREEDGVRASVPVKRALSVGVRVGVEACAYLYAPFPWFSPFLWDHSASYFFLTQHMGGSCFLI